MRTNIREILRVLERYDEDMTVFLDDESAEDSDYVGDYATLSAVLGEAEDHSEAEVPDWTQAGNADLASALELHADGQTDWLGTLLVETVRRLRQQALATRIADAKIAAAGELYEACHQAFWDKSEGFTCSEAEVLAEFIRQFGNDDMAQRFLEAHAMGDEECDLHYNPDLKETSSGA